MRRFFGMMPSKEIEKTLYFKEKDGSKVKIDVGKNQSEQAGKTDP